MNEAQILHRADQYMQMMSGLVAAVIEDLGESPEALRGAAVVTEAACLIVATLVNAEHEGTDTEMAEMAAVATVIGHLVKDLDARLRQVVPS